MSPHSLSRIAVAATAALLCAGASPAFAAMPASTVQTPAAPTPSASTTAIPRSAVGAVRTATTTEPLTPVTEFDVNRYLGTWNQVAVIPQIFNLQCAKDTRATYGPVAPDVISVLNRCTTLVGSESKVTGKAAVVDPAAPAALRVTFDQVPFPPGPEANYIVAYVDPDYQFALVGNADRSSGFVLSRTAQLSDAEWRSVKSIVEAKGYNSCAFWVSPLTGGRAVPTPLCWVR